MSWFKIDDKFHHHPKVLRLLAEYPEEYGDALALWIRCGSYSAEYLTNGALSMSVVRSLSSRPRSTERLLNALLAVSLWEQLADGIVFKDWLEYNPSAEDVKEKRAASSSRVAAHRANVTRYKSVTPPPPVTPLPTRPDPEELKKGARDESGQAAKEAKAPTNPKAELALKLKKAYQNEHETRFPEKGAWQSFNLFSAEFDEMAKNCVDEKDASATVKAFFESRDPFVIKAEYSPRLLAKKWHSYKGGTYAKQAVSAVNPAEWVFDFHNEPPTNHPMYSTWERMYNAEIKRKTGSQ